MKPMRVAFLVLLASVVMAAPAHAGTYDVWGCRLPGGLIAPINGWQPEGSASNHCSLTNGMTASLPAAALPGGSYAGWVFEAPSGSAIRGYELYRSARTDSSAGSIRAYGLYHDMPVFDRDVTTFEFCTAIWGSCFRVGDPDANWPMDPDNAVTRSGLDIRRLYLRLTCGIPGDTAVCGASAVPASLVVGRSRIALADDSAPTLGTITGAPTRDGAFLEGPQAVDVSATDQGGGIKELLVLIDGAPVGAASVDGVKASCRAPFVDVVPCPASASAVVSFPTSSIANGRHTMQVAVDDAAGNRTTSGAWTVLVANGAVANGTGASRAATLRAGFEARGVKRKPRETTRRYRGRAAVSGRLVDASRRPIAGARLDVVGRPARTGAKFRKEGEVLTRADGTFRYRTRRGPSRELRFEYRAYSLDPTPAARASVTLNVRAGVRLSVRPQRTTSRGTIRFRGRLLGRAGRDGLQVTLYAIDRSGRKRVPVEVVRTNAKGRFRFRYRFVRTFAPFTYRFLARLERQPTYPYAAASSAPATVYVVR